MRLFAERYFAVFTTFVSFKCLVWAIGQEGYIEELTRFSQCLNAKTGFVNI